MKLSRDVILLAAIDAGFTVESRDIEKWKNFVMTIELTLEELNKK